MQAAFYRSTEAPGRLPLIEDAYEGQAGYCACDVQVIDSEGSRGALTRLVIDENLLTVYSDSRSILRMVCTPMQMPQMVLGYLYSEGLIDDLSEVESLRISRDGTQAKLRFASGSRELRDDLVLSSVGARRVESRTPRVREPAPVSAHHWDAAEIFELARLFHEEAEIYSKTRGVHSCLLGFEGKIRFFCEDIGRHNAMDKAIGCALLEGLPLSGAFLYTSGRVPVDMVVKAIRSGIPVLASKSVPSRQAVEMARRYGLTLICAAKPASIQVFTNFSEREHDDERE